MRTTTTTIAIRPEQRSAIQTLAYFAVFNYPLKLNEIRDFSDLDVTPECIMEMVKLDWIKKEGDFYGLPNSISQIKDRLEGNDRALKLEQKAVRKARFIGQFPFVRSVSVSGSMSKGYMDHEADIDFFIVTEPGRLWVARTMLILYKKVFLLNSRKYFCVNYFVDTEHLQIEEKNRFTSTEVVTLRNMYGSDLFKDFLKENQWAVQGHPNYQANHVESSDKNKWMKRTSERLLKGRMGERLDAFFMKRTLKRWQRKFGTMDAEQFDVAFKTRTYVSKHHPGNFQQQVLSRMGQHLKNWEQEHQIQLDD